MPVSQFISYCHCERSDAFRRDGVQPARRLLRRYAPRNDSMVGLSLLQLDQRAAEILGMQEQHRLVMCAEAWLAVAEHAGPFGTQAVAGHDDVVDLVANVMQAAG